MGIVKPGVCPRLIRGHPLGKGLAASWLMNERYGPIVYDASGNNNDGVMTKMDPEVDRVSSEMGAALDFDGVDDNANCGNPTSLQSFSALSLVFHIYPTDLDWARAIIGKADNGGQGYALFSTPTCWRLQLWTSTGRKELDSSDVTPWNNSWYRIAATWDGAEARIYLNGALDTSQALDGTITNTTLDCTIGLWGIGLFKPHFEGQIATGKIYNRGLSASEVNWLDRDPDCMFEPLGWKPWMRVPRHTFGATPGATAITERRPGASAITERNPGATEIVVR